MYFSFEHITAAYGKNVVLRDFSMEIPRGNIVTLIGANGCGKSTLLKTVTRAVTPTSGRILFDEKPLTAYSPKQLAQKIACLAQVHNAPPDLDVRTLVACGRYPYARFGRDARTSDRAIVERAIEMTGLQKLSSRQLSTLSGGEVQRAWIAMAVAQEPEILILDEPTTYLDIGYQMEILELVRRLQDACGMTILMVLHDLNLAARYSDMLCAMKDGALYASGTPREVLTADNLRALFGIRAQILEDAAHDCPYFVPDVAEKGEIS